MAGESSEPIERWTAKRRVALVVSILKGAPINAGGLISGELYIA